MSYWTEETPTIVDTGANVLRYYPQAGKLQVSLPDWLNKEGDSCQGKTVAVDVEALQANSKAVALLTQLLGE
ncbi:MAG: hypothetical protein RR115_07055 [Hydrogenoanaerobacterium sp.]